MKDGFINGVKIESTSINPKIGMNDGQIHASVNYFDKIKINFLQSRKIVVSFRFYTKTLANFDKKKIFKITFIDNVKQSVLDENGKIGTYFLGTSYEEKEN
jgi:hypothetical protein